MKKICIIDSCRTGVGSFNGSLSQIKPQDYTSELIKHLTAKYPVVKDKIGRVILGHVLQSGLGQNTARQALMNSGLSESITAYTVNMVCGSGLKSVMLGCLELQNQDVEFVIAGGHENMSLAPHFIQNRNDKNVKRLGDLTLSDSILADGLTDVFNNYHMGITAENLAKKYSISREEQDQYSLFSQQKASQASKDGLFRDEIIAIKIKNNTETFDQDEFIRHDTNLEKLAKLKTVFSKESDATVTPGNSSGINDGAAICLLASEETVKKYNLKPSAEIISFDESGVNPKIMGIGPVEACRNVMKKSGLKMNDIDLFEVNEAFAAQVLAVIKELNIDTSKLNIKGGAIALGHPIGASGGRCLTTLLHSLKQQKLEQGLVSLCIGGGMGVAMIVRNMC